MSTVVWVERAVQVIGRTMFIPPTDLNTGDQYYEPDGFTGSDLAEFAGRACYESWGRANPDTATNKGYLSHILDVAHHSVIEHASVSLYITGVSRSLTHELVRHRHGSYSQLSQRYVDSGDVQFVIPPEYRGDEAAILDLETVGALAIETYNRRVQAGLAKGLKRKEARQSARSVLPNMTETRLVMTGNYRAWLEFLIKRDSPAADVEIRGLARDIGVLLGRDAPNIFGPDAREKWDLSAQQTPTQH